MIHTIAKRNGRELSPEIMGIINQRQGCFPGCFLWPVTLGLEFVKRLYRTVLYFLTIKSATDQLSYYWHRAFLLDYMLRRGDLDNAAKAKIASAALQTLLKTTTTSPLFQLANKISAGVNHIFRTLWQFLRRHREDEVVVNTRKEMEESWGKFSDYLIELAARYDILFTEIEQTQIGEMIHDQS